MHQAAQHTALTQILPPGFQQEMELGQAAKLQLVPAAPTARRKRIGRYEVQDVIGCGGFSVVYKGYDPIIGRPVAIKICDRADRETRNRFRREAVVGRMMTHRNLTRVYDFGADGSSMYLIQEYLSGEDLADLILRRHPRSLGQKLDLLLQVASGLAHAHSKGVIHRDVKPSNVRVLDDGRVKIMDFGSAKRPMVDSQMTEVGTILGTVAYMPPESLLGEPPQASSDIYAFGVLAYELLSFRRPFDANRLPILIHQIQTSSPRPITATHACPSDLEGIIQRCLSKQPEDRPRCFAELELELNRIRDRHPRAVENRWIA